jgi:hypothetical protein
MPDEVKVIEVQGEVVQPSNAKPGRETQLNRKNDK